MDADVQPLALIKKMAQHVLMRSSVFSPRIKGDAATQTPSRAHVVRSPAEEEEEGFVVGDMKKEEK